MKESFAVSTCVCIHALFSPPGGLIDFKHTRGGLLERRAYKRGRLNKF